MKPIEFKEISLGSIANGAAEQLFKRELNQVFKNIDDMNTLVTTPREINLKFKFKPNADRDSAEVELHVSSKLAPVKAVDTSVHIVEEKGGRFTAYQKADEMENVTGLTEYAAN